MQRELSLYSYIYKRLVYITLILFIVFKMVSLVLSYHTIQNHEQNYQGIYTSEIIKNEKSLVKNGLILDLIQLIILLLFIGFTINKSSKRVNTILKKLNIYFEDHKLDIRGVKEYLFEFKELKPVIEEFDSIIRDRDDLTNMIEEKKEIISVLIKKSELLLTHIDSNGFLIETSDSFIEYLGYDLQTITSINWDSIVNNYEKDFYKIITQLNDENSNITLNRELITKIGTVIETEITFYKIYNESKNLNEYIVIIKDMITNEMSFEKQIHSDKLRSIGKLTGSIVNDYNNHLSGILGSIELLKLNSDKGDFSKNDKYLDNIKKSAIISTDLTKRLLSFVKDNDHTLKVINLNRVVEDIVGLIRHVVDSKVDIIDRICNEDLNIFANQMLIENALMNLSINSKEALNGSGFIEISTVFIDKIFIKDKQLEYSKYKLNNDLNYAELMIKDSGIGFSDDILHKIFDPFFTTKKYGNGMGLTSVLREIQDNNGAISVESIEGIGTTFKILLPIIEQEEVVEVEYINDNNILANTHILVVDDDMLILENLTELLAEKKVNVYATIFPKEIISLVRKHPNKFDLVIVDMIMPEMSGIELFNEIRLINPKIKVLISSGYSKTEDIYTILSQERSGYIQKPYQSIELYRAIEEII